LRWSVFSKPGRSGAPSASAASEHAGQNEHMPDGKRGTCSLGGVKV
jgi:hypothetical protein